MHATYAEDSEGGTVKDFVSKTLMWYLMGLHPTQFSIFGNTFITEIEEKKRAMFGLRTTNNVEGENNACWRKCC